MRAAPLLALLAAAACRSATPAANAPAAPAAERSAAPRFDIAYRVGFTEPDSHLYSVQIDIGNVVGDDVRLQLPVWSPGRYARFDFARNVQEFVVTANGAPVRWERENGSLWRLHPAGARSLTVRYRVFANTLSGTFSVLDTAHANWNGASLFMYVVDHKPDPVRLHVDAPAGWHVINGSDRVADQRDYEFPDYDHLIDTPTEVAREVMVDTMRIDGRIYRSVVHHNGPAPAGVRQRFVGDVQKIVRYENGVFGAPPLEAYTFLFNIGYAGGDGMEHLYSTQIINRNAWTDTAQLLPGIATAAHEYFHVWNVKRVRPMALGPFDYTSERYQPSLWVAEGWTQYYGQMALVRGGVLPRASLYPTAASLVRANLTAPGRKEVSARMASFLAPFWDGAAQGYATNGGQTFFSYYTKGAGIALYLDLLIRSRSDNQRSLDDAFRNLRRLSWEQPNASYYLQGRGYTEADVERAVSEAAGMDMHDWFERHVGGTEDMDYDQALGWAGLRLTRGATDWRIEEIPDATPAQRRVREGWASGRAGG